MILRVLMLRVLIVMRLPRSLTHHASLGNASTPPDRPGRWDWSAHCLIDARKERVGQIGRVIERAAARDDNALAFLDDKELQQRCRLGRGGDANAGITTGTHRELQHVPRRLRVILGAKFVAPSRIMVRAAKSFRFFGAEARCCCAVRPG